MSAPRGIIVAAAAHTVRRVRPNVRAPLDGLAGHRRQQMLGPRAEASAQSTGAMAPAGWAVAGGTWGSVRMASSAAPRQAKGGAADSAQVLVCDVVLCLILAPGGLGRATGAHAETDANGRTCRTRSRRWTTARRRKTCRSAC